LLLLAAIYYSPFFILKWQNCGKYLKSCGGPPAKKAKRGDPVPKDQQKLELSHLKIFTLMVA